MPAQNVSFLMLYFFNFQIFKKGTKFLCLQCGFTFSSVQVKKWLKTSDLDSTGCLVILSIHNCNIFILESMNSSSYRPEDTNRNILHVFCSENLNLTFCT